ncbi:MAG: hypothetical protein ABI873_05895 [Marmoricola sp.]
MFSNRTITGLAVAGLASVAVTAGAANAHGHHAGQGHGNNGNAHLRWSDVASANVKAAGLTSPNDLSVQLAEIARAQGSNVVENPRDGVGYYGYDSVDGNPTLMPTGANSAEANKTEPDKNTYLVLRGQKGPTPGTTTACTSSSRVTRPALPATSPASSWTPMPLTGSP